MSGAWVRRARLAASLGRPIPTKQVMSLVSARAAVMLIISEEVNSIVISGSSFLEYVFLQPGLEQLAITGDGVPFLVEGVVALVVTQGVGRCSAPLGDGNGGDGPEGKHTVVTRSTQVINDLFHGVEAALTRQLGLLLHPAAAFHQPVAHAVGALGL